MRIGLVHSQYRRQGGAETYFLDLVAGFAAAGHPIDVYVLKHDRLISVPDNVNIHLWRWLGLPKMLKKWCFANWVNRQLQKHQYDLTLSNARTTGQKIMICGGCHAGYLKRLQKRQSIKDQIELTLEKRAYQSANYIVAHSQQIAVELAEHYPEVQHKIVTLYPPCDIDRFRPLSVSKYTGLRRQFGMLDQRINLVFPSSGNKKMKGHYLLLDALKLLPTDRYQLFLAGCDDQPDQPNIHALGFVEDMPGLLSAADFVVLPSFYEAFGLVVIEALACGTPVVVSKHVGAAELITDKEGIIYQQQSPQCLAQAIETAADKHFDIAEDFCQQHQLTIDQHIAALAKLIK